MQEVEADVRCIGSTCRDLERMAQAGGIREELCHRLAASRVWVPPLRERERDVLLLAQHFVEHFNVRMAKTVQGLDHEAEQALLRHTFPGNVRQLRHAVEQAMIQARGERLTVDDFAGLASDPEERGLQERWPAVTAGDEQALGHRLAEVRQSEADLWREEREIIQSALSRAGGNKSRAARLLGISRYALMRRLRRMG
jgi:DNA-binding NtrC family response regulator